MTGLRETPRAPYLPHVPRFVWPSGDLRLSLPFTPIEYSLGSVGGDIEADSGVRAAFTVRQDEFWTFTLRFYEEEWPAVQAFIDFAQTGEEFTWYPDILDQSYSYSLRLEAPAVGSTYFARPHPDYPLVQLLDITVVAAPQEFFTNSDAILKPRIIWMDGFGAGQQHATGHVNFADTKGIEYLVSRYRDLNAGDSHLAIVDPPTDLFGYWDATDTWDHFLTGGRGGGCMISKETLGDAQNGQWSWIPFRSDSVVPGGDVCIGLDLQGQVLSQPLYLLNFGFAIGINPEDTFLQIGSHAAVVIDTDRRVSVRRFVGDDGDWTDVLGVSTIQVPADGPFTLEAALWMSNTVGGVQFPTGFGYVRLYTPDNPLGTTIINRRKIITTQLSLGTIGGVAWGTDARAKAGVGRGIAGIKFDGVVAADGQGTVKRYLYDTRVGTSLIIGPGDVAESEISFESYVHGVTDRWRNVAELDPEGFYNDPHYNTFGDEAIDTYAIQGAKSVAKEILAVSPCCTKIHWQYPNFSPNAEALAESDKYHDVGIGFGTFGRMLIKYQTILALGELVTSDSAWLGFACFDVFEKDLITLQRWLPSAIQNILIGYKSAPAPSISMVQFMALDYVYREQIINDTEHPPYPPNAEFLHIDLEPEAGLGNHWWLRDASVDWDGTIVAREWNFDDGSSFEDGIEAFHTWTLPGVYHVKLTVTDNDGLKSTQTWILTVANQAPVANFSYDIDPDDPSGLTIDFTSGCDDPDGTIVSQAWTFGDGGTSTALNPVHSYMASGTYIVTVTATDNLGATDVFSADVVVELTATDRVNMPIVFSDSASAGLNQSTERYDFQAGTPVLAVGGGRDGRDAIEEGDGSTFWSYTLRHNDPHAFQFVFDLQGLTLPGYEVPLFDIFRTLQVVLRPDGKLRVYVADASLVWTQAFETAAAVPTTGMVHGMLRFGNGGSSAGWVALRVNGESLLADPITIQPTGTVLNNTVSVGTGSGFDGSRTPSGYLQGIVGVRWCDFTMFDDSAVLANHAAHPGDVHYAVCLPQAIGTYNDSGGSSANVQTANEATSMNTFTATDQKDTFTQNTPSGTLATILAVLPFYEGFRGGTLGTRKFAMLLKSGGTLAQSADINSSSSWTARFRVISADTLDRWVLLTDPATAAAWANAAAIGAAEIGMKAVAVNAGGTLLYSQVGAEVAYWDV